MDYHNEMMEHDLLQVSKVLGFDQEIYQNQEFQNIVNYLYHLVGMTYNYEPVVIILLLKILL
jgi:hypothetical protein